MATLTFDGRVAIVTGAGGGLGREHALLLAERGAAVVVNDVGAAVSGEGESKTPAEKVVAEITERGGQAVADGNSVATPEGGAAIVQSALDSFGRVDIIINNAGILRDKSFKNMTPELVDPVIDVHLRGAFHVTQPAWEHMREQGYGRVLNTTSAAGLFGNFGQTNYSAAKMGLVGFTRTLAQEGASHGINVNVITPIARTRMTEELLGEFAEYVDPALVAPAAAWLVHEDCPATGEIYSVVAGRVARVFVGLAKGWYDPEITPEKVRENFEAIRDVSEYIEPGSPADEIAELAQRLGAA